AVDSVRKTRVVVALGELDAEAFELRAHGRIDVRVGARDAMARRLRDRGDAAHEGAADAEDVYVHQPVTGGNIESFNASSRSQKPIEKARPRKYGRSIARPKMNPVMSIPQSSTIVKSTWTTVMSEPPCPSDRAQRGIRREER